MDTQLDLFSVNEQNRLAETAALKQLPQEARAKMRELLAGIVTKHLQSTTNNKSEHDEQQFEN